VKITRIDLWHVAAPLPAPFHPSWIPGFRQTENRFDLIRIATACGVEGWSAAPCMGREREGWGQLLGNYFLGERVDDIANIRQRIREMSYLGHRAGGLVEPACWDAVGKARGEPVYKILGGRGGQVDLYASTGEMKSGEARAEEVLARMEEGFHAVKLRVHADTLAEDIDQIRITRERVGDSVLLGVDANQGWRVAAIAECAKWSHERAMNFCESAGELGFSWVEEPLPFDDYSGLAALTASTSVAIAGGELNAYGLPEFRHMVREGCLDWYQPDAIMVGGVSETMAIIEELKRHSAVYTPHTWTNGIGMAINLAVFAASGFSDTGHLEYPLDPPGWTVQGRDALLKEPLVHRRGKLTIPEGPGFGFEIDRRALRRYGRRFSTSTKVRVSLAAVVDRGLSNARALGATRQARLDRRHQQVEVVLAAGGDPAVDPIRALAREA